MFRSVCKKLLNIDNGAENKIISCIMDERGVPDDYGWCRVTFHYTMLNYIIRYIICAISFIAFHGKLFLDQYQYISSKNIWKHRTFVDDFERTEFTFDEGCEKYDNCECMLSEKESLKILIHAYKLAKSL